MKHETKVIYSFAIALALVSGVVAMGAVAKSDSANSAKTNSGKSDVAKNNTVQTQNATRTNNPNSTVPVPGKKIDVVTDVTDYQKPDKTKGETNSQVHLEKTQEVTKNLKKAAAEEQAVGNATVSDQIEAVVAEQEQTQAEVAEAIEEVESRGKLKILIVGQDYKNLGQLRSEIVQNRNQIRQLTKALTRTQAEEGETISTSLETLLQEQERLKALIADNEDKFSLFGWVFRYMSGYEKTPIDDSVDDQLADEAQTAIDEAAEEEVPAETTEPAVAPGETVPTETETITPEVPQTTPEAPVLDTTPAL